MSPILGIYASQISGHLYANSYDALGVVTVGAGGVSSVSFTGIPSTYQHLQIRFLSRDNRSATANSIAIQFNSDSGSNYSLHQLEGDGSTAAAYASTSTTNARWLALSTSASVASNIFAAGVIDILDYANTNKYKTGRSLVGYDTNGGGAVNFNSGLWMSTSAISTITLTPTVTASFVQYSSFALYGVK